ncbi:hypothetical protein HU200_060433 [Digitaria exilis]|uniref:F-box domain-containing protein n=1 Tax=Digitaria exilis TaxID=1010633 RepID=A0A835E299_9POAL|nr:hypothetical protein HU200_060433 [Digitaria exilis]
MATMIISSPPPAEDAMSASKVLGDEDLLGEILRRVDSPTSLVRAALVSKRWLRTASGRDLVRCFCALHPPCRHLLGFYVTGDCVPRPEFVSMPALEPHDRELSAVLRQASNSVFEAFPEYSSRVWDSRDGRVLFDFTETSTEHGAEAVLAMAPDRIPLLTRLASGKLYMVAVAGYILGLDMATSELLRHRLPRGRGVRVLRQPCSLPGRRLCSVPHPSHGRSALRLAPQDRG